MYKLVWIMTFLGISFSTQWWNPVYIFQTNQSKKEATSLFEEEKFKEAASELRYLNNTLKLEEPSITIDLAHAYFEQQDTSAVIYYQEASRSPNDDIKSTAYLQMGVLKVRRAESVDPNNKQKVYEAALEDFKEALRADDTNGKARFDYELLKRLMELNQEQQEQQQQQQQNQEQEQEQEQNQNQDQSQNQDEKSEEEQEQNQNKEEENQENQSQQQQQSASERLKDMEISMDKAEQLLEAMKQNEAQYLQQLQRRGKKKRNTNKPDW